MIFSCIKHTYYSILWFSWWQWKTNTELNDRYKPFIFSCQPLVLLYLYICPGRLRSCDSFTGVAISDTYKHSGSGIVWRLFFCGFAETFGLLFSCTRGTDTSFISFQKVKRLPPSGSHTDQDLLHHCQLLENQVVHENRDVKPVWNNKIGVLMRDKWECTVQKAEYLNWTTRFIWKTLKKWLSIFSDDHF